jgi:hypothetical protein
MKHLSPFDGVLFHESLNVSALDRYSQDTRVSGLQRITHPNRSGR